VQELLEKESSHNEFARSNTKTAQPVKLPELLLRNRKFHQMEIDMDKFLAKKHPIFKGASQEEGFGLGINLKGTSLRYKLNGNIL